MWVSNSLRPDYATDAEEGGAIDSSASLSNLCLLSTRLSLSAIALFALFSLMNSFTPNDRLGITSGD